MAALDDNLRKAEAYLERFRKGGVLNQIGGEAVPAADGSTFETLSPVDLKPIATNDSKPTYSPEPDSPRTGLAI